MLKSLFKNHVLANLAFILVIVMGVLSYQQLPREQDPTVNFNWINIFTAFPGASSADVERQVTNVLEDAIQKVSDIKFSSSTSRSGISNIVVRFEDIKERVFEKRLADLRREIDGIKSDLPSIVDDPFVYEITTDNALPTATIVVSSFSDDENLRRQASLIKQDIQQLKGVETVLDIGLALPEIQILFKPELLEQYKITPLSIAQTIQSYFQNTAAGTLSVEQIDWEIKVTGRYSALDYLENIPIVTARGEVPLKQVADIVRSKEKVEELISFNGKPSVLLIVNKKAKQNVLQLIDTLASFLEQKQSSYQALGISVYLEDNQTQITQNALSVMQTNAIFGLVLVVLTTWIMLGLRIALITGSAIPFILCGLFWFLTGIDQTLNVTVLLGIVIALGMLVDDAVVVLEAIYYQLQRKVATLEATITGLKEVIVPVTTAVLTTMAAFLPLMLLPGILGKFMLIVPLVITATLAISLVEAYWLLPAHIVAFKINFKNPTKSQKFRQLIHRKIRKNYTKTLLKFMRRPLLAIGLLSIIGGGVLFAILGEKIKFDFFASEPERIFYINVKLPAGTELQATMEKVNEVEATTRQHIQDDEMSSIFSYAGEIFTEVAPLTGSQYGQVQISLQPQIDDGRSVDEIIDSLEQNLTSIPGIEKLSFLRESSGPPSTKEVSVKIRGYDFDTLAAASKELKTFMESNPEYKNISDNYESGSNILNLVVNSAAVQRTGITPQQITRTIRLLVDGEIVSSLRDQGEKINIRLKSQNQLEQIDDLLQYRLSNNSGQLIPLNQLVDADFSKGLSQIRHYNYRRTITVESNIDKSVTDTLKANNLIRAHWQEVAHHYPTVDLDFSGLLDDINESISSLAILFLFGLGLIYLILGTQFQSYFQPLLTLSSIFMALSGVIIGLWLSGYPLSLYTMYGIVALGGIAVNSAIVLISAANTRLKAGMSVSHAIVFAARRRVLPILITSFTTIAGLFSLATGLGGSSLLWTPIATSMVWGLTVSTILTLFYTPFFYRVFMLPWNFKPLLKRQKNRFLNSQ